jgi:hypothetical protein
MVKRTLLSKSNTIVKGSKENLGLNPICMLKYGKQITRCLLYFDLKNVRDLIDKGYQQDALTHILRMTNCGSIDFTKSFKDAERTSSFNVILLRAPLTWDEGIGFDETGDYWITGKKSYSENGSNWYQAHNGVKWKEQILDGGVTTDDGIFSNEYIVEEYRKFLQGESGAIIGAQHFDHGNENLSIDITKYINSCLNGEPNNGLCLMFAPLVESIENEKTEYVGFFSPHTNTFFAPVIETRIRDFGKDCRNCFIAGETNRIFFSLSKPSTDPLMCTVECGTYRETLPPTMITLTDYYVDITIDNPESKIVDITWSGFAAEDFTETITIKQALDYFIPGKKTGLPSKRFSPIVYQINDNEDLVQGICRFVFVDFQIAYESEKFIPDNAFYKLYIKDGQKDVGVIEWDNFSNWFEIDTNSLLPNKYYVDIKTENNSETELFKDVLHFNVVSNETDTKR